MRLVTLAALSLTFALVGCANPAPHSCTIPPRDPGGSIVCVDFVAAVATSPETFERSICTNLSGTFSTAGACSTDARVGRCTETTVQGDSSYTLRLNFYAPATTADGAAACPPPMPPAGTTFEFQAN